MLWDMKLNILCKKIKNNNDIKLKNVIDFRNFCFYIILLYKKNILITVKTLQIIRITLFISVKLFSIL